MKIVSTNKLKNIIESVSYPYFDKSNNEFMEVIPDELSKIKNHDCQKIYQASKHLNKIYVNVNQPKGGSQEGRCKLLETGGFICSDGTKVLASGEIIPGKDKDNPEDLFDSYIKRQTSLERRAHRDYQKYTNND